MMNIRKMKEEDISACADILCSIYNNEIWQCRWSHETAFEYLTDYFEMRKFVGYVIDEDGVILGGLFAYEKVWWNKSEVLVEEMLVKPQFRRRGYGTLLLKQVETYIREKGLAGITLSNNKFAPIPNLYSR